MIKIRYCLFIFFIGWLISSCNSRPEKSPLAIKKLFSIDSLITGQSKILSGLNITVNREADINGEHNKITFNPDSGFWHKELSVIAATDIGKPSLFDRYEISKSDSIGINFTNYTAIDPTLDGTTHLLVGTDSSGRIVKIKIEQKEKNFIYVSNRNMILNFAYNKMADTNIIKDYLIEGSQKILFRKRIKYYISVSLTSHPAG